MDEASKRHVELKEDQQPQIHATQVGTSSQK